MTPRLLMQSWFKSERVPMVDAWSLPEKDLETLRESRVVLSMSGGKDSTACALLLERHGVEFESVFMDTGWEHPVLYDYIRDVLEPRFGTVTTLRSDKHPEGMAQLVRAKGMFPSRLLRFCTEELKFKPFKKWIASQDEEVVSVVGIRRQESASRAGAERWSYDGALECDVFRPLVDHTFDDVISMHREGDIPPNPLYLQGASRVGCFPCIFARKAEVAHVGRWWPARIDEIREIEEELTSRFLNKLEADPEAKAGVVDMVKDRAAHTVVAKSFPDLRWSAWKEGNLSEEEGAAAVVARAAVEDGKYPEIVESEWTRKTSRTYFHGRVDGTIDDGVLWAKTSRGGHQFQLFDLTAQDGCMRWGMCESAMADSELVKIREGSG